MTDRAKPWPASAPPRVQRVAALGAEREDALQTALFNHVAMYGRRDVVAFAIPNGGWRSKSEAARMKAAGVVAGMPDVGILCEGRVYFLELKTTAGKLSPTQRIVHERMRAAGHPVSVAYGLDDALAQLRRWGILPS